MPGTGRVTDRMTGRESSTSSSTDMMSACDCNKSLTKIRRLFATWEKALRSSGIMEEDKEEGGRNRKRKK